MSFSTTNQEFAATGKHDILNMLLEKLWSMPQEWRHATSSYWVDMKYNIHNIVTGIQAYNTLLLHLCQKNILKPEELTWLEIVNLILTLKGEMMEAFSLVGCQHADSLVKPLNKNKYWITNILLFLILIFSIFVYGVTSDIPSLWYIINQVLKAHMIVKVYKRFSWWLDGSWYVKVSTLNHTFLVILVVEIKATQIKVHG